MARWTLALDISGPVKASFLEWLKTTCGLAVSLEDLRSIMSTLSRDACAMAGHAAALSQWHLVSGSGGSSGGAEGRLGAEGACTAVCRAALSTAWCLTRGTAASGVGTKRAVSRALSPVTLQPTHRRRTGSATGAAGPPSPPRRASGASASASTSSTRAPTPW